MNNLTKNYIERKEEFNNKFLIGFPGQKPEGKAIYNLCKKELLSTQKSDILSVLDVIEKWGEENALTSIFILKSDLLQFVKVAKEEINKE